MKFNLRVGLSVGVVLLAVHGVFAQNAKPSPAFDGKYLPEPPEQRAAWTAPPTTLPAEVPAAVDLLFQQGMADPRGCEYRTVEVVTGNVWSGDDGPQKVHAWVFPAQQAGAQRFAVCWNGLVYPAISVGDRADLKADVNAMIAEDVKAQADWAKQNPKGQIPYRRGWSVIHEASAVSSSQICKMKICLLLRLGEGALATAYWAQFNSDPDTALTQREHMPNAAEDDTYLSLARGWAWMAFDRAVCAHMRGDDVVSRDTASLLSKAQDKIDDTAAARKLDRPKVWDQKINDFVWAPTFLEFLQPLPALLADEEQRVTEGKIDRVVDRPEEYKDKSKRIAALIRDLEEVSARQWSQPGGVSLDSDPNAEALEEEGLNAVEPILDCLANDDRLTRAVSFGRDFHTGRDLLPVDEAAYGTLCHILQVAQFGPLTENGWNINSDNRAAVVVEIRAYWQKNKDAAPAERWYRILADDHAQPKQWLEAASRIVQPTDEEIRGGWVTEPQRKPGEVPPMQGESLRSKQNPSVVELLAKRAPQIAAGDTRTSNEIFFGDDAVEVILALTRWDIKAAIPAIKTQLIAEKKVSADWGGRSSQDDLIIRDMATLYSALQNAGDSSANKEYADWIRHLPVPQMPSNDRLFQPLWQNPNDPDIAAAADWLFNDAGSNWHCLAMTHESFHETLPDLVISPLIGVPAFQKSLLTNLRDQTPVGQIWVDDHGLQTDHDFDIGMNITDPNDPLLPKPLEKRTVRVCDWYAKALSRLEGSPQFEDFWPQEKRDAAIAECIVFVHDWADRFAWNATQKVLFDPRFDPARMIFEHRDRPATNAEAAAHTAIFSLAGGGEVRIVPLDRFPTQAKWTTLKRFVVHHGLADDKVSTEFDQDGWVWQAEEQWVEGKCKRYYGFVGNHIVAKVPAEEIQLGNSPESDTATQP